VNELLLAEIPVRLHAKVIQVEIQAARQPVDDAHVDAHLVIEAALARSQGKVAGADGAAALVGIPASTLESKIRQLKIEKGRYTRPSR
jgi:transcriptional regulator with GAF, ATPase, and Fis domain